jgi:DNA-binding transcriptional LysR family regulator
MDLLSLKTFQTVVDEGGFLAASRKLHTVQSNVTTRIRKLEEELGTELFFRKGRGIELAPSGRVLLDYSRKMLLLERQTEAAIKQVGESIGQIRLGAFDTFAGLHLPIGMKALKSRYPKVDVHVETGSSADLIEKVLSHQLDAAFVAGPVIHPELEFDQVITEELVEVSARGSDPVLQPVILFHQGCAYRARALAYQRSIGHAQSDTMTFGTLEGILGCVSVGLGWTLMPKRAVERSTYVDQLHIRKVPREFAFVPTGLVRLKDFPTLPAVVAISDAVSAQSA